MTAPTSPVARVGDTDRENTAALLGQALTEGYLDVAEYDTRMQTAFTAPTRAALSAVTADLPVALLRRHDPRRREARRRAALRGLQIHLGAYLTMVVIVLTVWLAVGLTAGAWYFWPIWPILGAGIGVLGHALPVKFGLAPRHLTHGCAGRASAPLIRSPLYDAG